MKPKFMKGCEDNGLDLEKVEAENTEYDKTGTTIAIGVHTSLSDIFSNISSRGLTLNFKQLLELYAELGFNKWELEDALGKTEEGTDAYLRGGIRLGDSEGWELSLYMENTKVAEVDTNEICPIGGSCYTDVDYTLSEETDSTMGIKFVNNFRENMSFSVNLDNNDSAGSTASLGIRFRL